MRRFVMKRIGFICLWMGFMLPLAGLSAPYGEEGEAVSFTQPNGSVIELRVFGDEFYAVTETLDGYTVIFDPAVKAYFYATLSPDGKTLVSTGRMVETSALQRGSSIPQEPKHLRINATERNAQARERFLRWDEEMGISKQWEETKATRRAMEEAEKNGIQMSPPSFTTLGTKVGLTLLIDFDDDRRSISQAEIKNYLNGDTYTGYTNNGSVKKYFQDNSRNLLTYSNVVTVYIRIPNSLHPKSWYNDPSKDAFDQGNLLIRDAIAIMKALTNYNTEILPQFDQVTVNGNNEVIALNAFYAGENSGVWGKGLWPQSWTLDDVGAQELSPGGKKVFKYQITNIGKSLTLGTFCHETGHMLCGYPDIYDHDRIDTNGDGKTDDYDSKGGAGMFCLMGSGRHAINPAQICAYLKRASGWATTVDLNVNSALTATVSSSGANFNRFYRYAKPGVPTEYYLVENRQRTGRDASLPAAGVAIWHIDERGNRDNQSMNYDNTTNHYEVSLMQADNLWHFQNNINSGDINDLYYNGNTASGYANRFDDNTAPSAKWWDGVSSGLIFKNFSARGVNMTFTVGRVVAVTSLAINSGAALSANRVVELNNVCWGSPAYYMASESSAFSGASWLTYSTAPNFTLSINNGAKTVYFKVKNSTGVESLSVSDTIVFSDPSVTSFSINSGAASTTNRVVKLNNVCSGSPTYYMASENSAFSGAAWLAYSTAPSFTLSTTTGIKTVYFRVKNSAGAVSVIASDTITLLGPSVTSLAINSGSASTTNRVVKLNNGCLGSPTHYMASENSAFSGAPWLAYSNAPSFTLSTTVGVKTVYFKVKNSGGIESLRLSDTITLWGLSVTNFAINSGAASTTNRVVKLNNGCLGSPTHYMASENPAFIGAAWLAYSTAPIFTLSTTAGIKAVYFRVKNSAGVESLGVRDTITLSGTSAPSGMALIPAGSFVMGNTFSGEGDGDELPLHTVSVSAFYMDRTEVTKAKWDEVKTWAVAHGYNFSNAGLGKAANHPVHTISWYDCVKWANARSQKEGLTPCYTVSGSTYKTGESAPTCNWTANGYRLPTEAEWEKAARGGVAGHRFPWSDSDTIQHARANYYVYSGDAYDTSPTRGDHPTYATGGYPYTSPVGVFAVNGYGLYDMAGNVWEWCWDWYGSYTSGTSTDPRGPGSGSGRVVRGGSWFDYANLCRVALRMISYWPESTSSFVGFRLLRTAP